MTDQVPTNAVENWARDVAAWRNDEPGTVTALDGGYSWQTFRVTAGDASVIVRIAPLGGTVEPHDPHLEANALREAGAIGLPVATVLAIDDGELLGRPAAIHSDLSGTSIRPGDDAGDRRAYRKSFATTLGRIHAAMPAEDITIRESYERMLEEEIDHYRRAAPCAHPGFEVAWRWLLANLPDDGRPAVRLHGDYRLANLLWTAPGVLSGVLDWERSRSGDPMCDVAFTRLFSGWCAIDGDAVAVYEASSGIELDPERLVYATLFERWRSFTSAMRGLAAFVDGRNQDERLVRIGLAGEAGAWRFIDELGAVDSYDRADLPPASYRSAIVETRSDSWQVLAEADTAARTRSLDKLPRRTARMPLRHSAGRRPENLFSDAHEWAVGALSRGRFPKRLLQALALRATLRYRLLEEHGWD